MTGDRDMFQCAAPDVTVLYLKTGVRGFEEMAPRGGARRATACRRSSCPTSSRCAATPPTACPAREGSARRRAADLLQRHGSLEAALARPTARRRASPGALRDQADELRDFLAIATLQRVDVARPADRATDLAGGADAAEALGMRRLAERLRAAGDPSRL